MSTRNRLDAKSTHTWRGVVPFDLRKVLVTAAELKEALSGS
jgi:hypothetical protein